jgi:hypothetical protein
LSNGNQHDTGIFRPYPAIGSGIVLNAADVVAVVVEGDEDDDEDATPPASTPIALLPLVPMSYILFCVVLGDFVVATGEGENAAAAAD